MEYSFQAARLLFTFDIHIYIFSWQINSAVVAASADYAVARCLSARLSVCPSVTRRYSVETVIHLFKLFTPSGSHTILVF